MHFGHAAQRLHIVQPALSKQIAALERELGVELFTRTKHRIEFTPAGRAFFAEARDILQRANHAANTAKMTASGAIGSLDIGFIGQAMFSFCRPYCGNTNSAMPGSVSYCRRCQARSRRPKSNKDDSSRVRSTIRP